MTRCLFCGGDYAEPLLFRRLLIPNKEHGFCPACRRQLAPISRLSQCRGCGRDLSLLHAPSIQTGMCDDCRLWTESGRNGRYGRNIALYTYDAFMKQIMVRFKFRGDALLAAGFAADLRNGFRQIRTARCGRYWFLPGRGDFVLVPVPLSMKRLAERGFNQADVLAEQVGAPVCHALERVKDEARQSRKNRRERLAARATPFHLKEGCASWIAGKHVLIIDDIYTTGATVRLAAAALAPAQPRSIDSLTLIHG